MMSESLLKEQQNSEDISIKKIKTDHISIDNPIQLLKSYAMIQNPSNKLIYEPNKSSSVYFEYFDKTNKEQYETKFNDDLIEHLKNEIYKSSSSNTKNIFLVTDLIDFIKDNKFYDISMIIKNEEEEKKCLKLDRNYTKVKSYDWEIMSETWFKQKSKFKNSKNVEEFFHAARKCSIVELSIYSKENSSNLQLVYLFLFDNPNKLQEFLAKLKYSVYFSKEALANYLYNYICDLIFRFVLPSSDVLAFYKNIEIKIKDEKIINDTFNSAEKSSSFSPLFKRVKEIEESIINDIIPLDLIGKEYKFSNLVRIINNFEESKFMPKECNEIKKELDEIFKNSPLYEKFFFNEMKKIVEKYISFKGVFNIDMILTNETGFHTNSKVDKVMKFLCFIPKCIVVDFFNKILKCNEGFFHKHIQVFDFCYNFNEKNIIHNFHANVDESQKNKIRIFDVLFKEKWTSKITSIITYILHFQSNFYTLNFDDGDDKYFYIRKIIHYMRTNILEIKDNLLKELFDDFPSFHLFCQGYYKFPQKKYNYIDNVCHHFANYTVKTLLKNNFIKFSYDVIIEIKMINKERKNSELIPIINYFPQLDTLYEECFILYDKELNNYLMQYFSLDQYLNQKFGTIDDFILKLKEIDCEMNRISTIELSLAELDHLTDNTIANNTVLENSELLDDEKTFPYAMYFNLYHFHRYNIMKEIYYLIMCYSAIKNDEIRDYIKKDIKKNIKSKILQLNELTFLVKNMTYKFYVYSNYIRGRLDKKNIIYSTSIGHYLIRVNPDNIEEQNYYENIYIDLKNKINLINN